MAPGGRIRPTQAAIWATDPRDATGSPAGFSYAARHSDLAFITSPAGANVVRAIEALPAHTAKLKAEARGFGREIRTIINPMIVCRSTEAEAREYYDEILRLADMEAVAGYANHFKSGDSKAWTNHVPRERILGGNVHLVGSPQQVADWLIALNRAGCDGMQISFLRFSRRPGILRHRRITSAAAGRRASTDRLEAILLATEAAIFRLLHDVGDL